MRISDWSSDVCSSDLISGEGQEPYPSRSLWERRLDITDRHDDREVHVYDSRQFIDEELRVLERDVMLPGSKTKWRFQTAASSESLEEKLRAVCATLIPSLMTLVLGLILLAAPQTFYRLCSPRYTRHPTPAISGGQTHLDHGHLTDRDGN